MHFIADKVLSLRKDLDLVMLEMTAELRSKEPLEVRWEVYNKIEHLLPTYPYGADIRLDKAGFLDYWDELGVKEGHYIKHSDILRTLKTLKLFNQQELHALKDRFVRSGYGGCSSGVREVCVEYDACT